MTVEKVLATVAWLLLLIGFRNYRRTRVHISAVLLAIIIDYSLVISLTINRGAIGIALTEPLTALQKLHIGSSSLTCLLYLLMVSLGVYLASSRSKAKELPRKLHRKIGYCCIALRSISLLTMFGM